MRAILQQVWAIEQDLNTIIVGRQEPIHLALLALLAEQHLFLLGPFGTAKSQLITELAARVGSPSGGGGGGLRTFIKLCAPGTKPEELFGPPSIAAMKQDVYRYATTNMLPEAELALLDEFFNAGEFLHGPVLSMMAERTFDNPTRMPVPLITLFSASNRVPRPESVISRAAWDRFPLRVIVEYVSDADFLRLLDLTPAPQSAQPMLTKAELRQLQQVVAAIPIPQAMKEAMLTLRRELRGKGVSISDRRWMQSRAILRAHALLEGRDAVEEDDLLVFQYMWEEPEQMAEIRSLCARLANPLNAKAVEFGDQAHSVYQAARQAIQQSMESDAQSNAAFDAVKKLKAITARLQALRETALNEGRNPARIEHVVRQVEDYRDEMAEQALGKIAPRQ